MRKTPTKAESSEVAISISDVAKMLSDLKSRMERVEVELFGTDADYIASPRMKPSMGRKPNLPPSEVITRRNNLTVWIERNWPYLSVQLRKAKTSKAAIKAIITAKTHLGGVFLPAFYNEPEKFEEVLWSFLKSGRFNGNPRNLAGAMAGLSEMSWKRSFDICSRYPCNFRLAVEAIRDYLHRRYPERLRELQKANTTDEVRVILRKTHADDPTFCQLKESPESVLEWLRLGKPINSYAAVSSELSEEDHQLFGPIKESGAQVGRL